MYDYNQDDNVGAEALPYGQRAASDAHKLTKKLIKKQIQRRQIERARAQAVQQTSRAAAEAGKKVAEEAAKLAKSAAELMRKAAQTVVEFVAANPVVLVILAVILAIFIVMLPKSIFVKRKTIQTSVLLHCLVQWVILLWQALIQPMMRISSV